MFKMAMVLKVHKFLGHPIQYLMQEQKKDRVLSGRQRAAGWVILKIS